MRDKTGTYNNLKDLIINNENSSELWLSKIEKGEANFDRIANLKRTISRNYLYNCNAKYSIGLDLSELFLDLSKAIDLCFESWDGFWKLKDRKGIEYDQYILSAYDEMLWMLSLGYFLNIPEEIFKKLVEVIDRDKVKDYLFEFIIAAKIKDRQLIKEESYNNFFSIPETFAKLRQAIQESDKLKAEKLVKAFITKDWYKNHKGTGWYNSHLSQHNVYFGYWSFETAAVVKIMHLDDSSFRDCQYYPKDLVNPPLS